MKARPILFSGPMVRGLLADAKTQTRRIVKPQPADIVTMIGADDQPTGEFGLVMDPEAMRVIQRFIRCPYGVPGDLLWVRETWSFIGQQGIWELYQASPTTCEPIYRADSVQADRWWPSIHMPRWASRLTLEITDVRVERVQDISEPDALAEGVRGTAFWRDEHPPSICFSLLWNSINGPDAWDANPWVWAVSFTVHRQNVDAFLAASAAGQSAEANGTGRLDTPNDTTPTDTGRAG